jgi:oligopeptide transport system permease protein
MLISIGLLAVIIAAALIGPLLSPYTLETVPLEQTDIAPTLQQWHVFGTDDLGRDVFVRTMKGAQMTLMVAAVATLVSLVIGVLYGAIAGYFGGVVDAAMMRAVDALYAMPFIFLVILLMVVFERSLVLIFIAIGAINWLDTARIVRGQTLSLKHRAFVDAARLTGVSSLGIIMRHIAPNLLGVITVYITLTIPQVILFESTLSFLGLGVQEPQTSLGALVSDGISRMEITPWVLLFPAVLLALLLATLNFLGDGLRDLFDPKSNQE